jgi:Na+/H+ antiporter NhaC
LDKPASAIDRNLLGVFTGSLIINGYNPLTAFLDLIDHIILPALADKDHAAIIIFSMMLGGMVGIISKNGGTRGIVKLVERIARTARLGQVATWLMGVIIFFDDYANTLIVGNTMRPITDRFKISREKLAYIVDSTAAPVAGLFLSTWIGYEVGVIGDAMKGTGYNVDPFSVFLLSIPYRSYLILTVIFVAMIATSMRDLGPMLKAEKRARAGKGLMERDAEPASDLTGTTQLIPKENTPFRWYNGIIPILVVIIVTMIGIWHTGYQAVLTSGQEVTLRTVLSNASSFTALFWGSLSGCTVGIVLSLGQRILTLHESVEAWFSGVRSMLLAMIIMLLAWSIGAVTKELGTAVYIVEILKDSLPLWALPALTFIIAAFISFATGTSWGTMAILMPLVVPLVWNMGLEAKLDPMMAHQSLYLGVSAVLAGAIWGDHCSPISDTTVMSSMASSCDHIDHVRTQMPYAIIVGLVSVAIYIPAALGLNIWMLLGISTVILAVFLRLFGRKSTQNIT